MKLSEMEITLIEDWFRLKYGDGIDGFEFQAINEMVPIYLEREGIKIYEVEYRKQGYIMLDEDQLYKIIKRA